jgi:hypothetical protein
VNVGFGFNFQRETLAVPTSNRFAPSSIVSSYFSITESSFLLNFSGYAMAIAIVFINALLTHLFMPL